MGKGPLGFDRPGTVGSEGWFGARRPLVGAANAIKVTVPTQSAAMVTVNNTTPDSIVNLRDQINEVNKEIDRLERKMDKFRRLGEVGVARQEGIAVRVAEQRFQSLDQQLGNLVDEKQRLVEKLDDMTEFIDEDQLKPYEIEDTIQDLLEKELSELGVTTGPIVDVGAEQTEIFVKMNNIKEEDVEEVRNRVDSLKLQISSVEAIEV